MAFQSPKTCISIINKSARYASEVLNFQINCFSVLRNMVFRCIENPSYWETINRHDSDQIRC